MFWRVALHCDRHMPLPRPAGQVSALASSLEASQCPCLVLAQEVQAQTRLKQLAGQCGEKGRHLSLKKPAATWQVGHSGVLWGL